jgi:hypothetical protein
VTRKRHSISYIFALVSVALVAPAWGHERLWMPPAPEFHGDDFPEPSKQAVSRAEEGLAVDTSNRADVVDFYNNVFLASEGIGANWNGSISTCDPGATSSAYQDAVLLRVNYYRAMAGLPADLALNIDWNVKCQDAALMMIAEPGLSHSPPTDWACYTAEGSEAAGKSNLALGAAGAAAIRNYIYDFAGDGSSANSQVGHRRWILYPPLQLTGTGDTTAHNGYFTGSNALWVADSAAFGTRPAEPEWVAWPPEGFVPYQVVDPNIVFFPGMTPENQRWSFSLYRANFAGATVTMTESGNPVSLQIVNRQNGYVVPDATIVWEPEGLPRKEAPPQDTTYSVTVDGVVDRFGVTRQFTYAVTIIDPASIPPSTPTRTATHTPTATLTPTETPTPSIPGDVNGDGMVDHFDVFLLANCWNTTDGESGFDLRCDFDGDSHVFAGDLFEILENW